jgi:hypothetical protein
LIKTNIQLTFNKKGYKNSMSAHKKFLSFEFANTTNKDILKVDGILKSL